MLPLSSPILLSPVNTCGLMNYPMLGIEKLTPSVLKLKGIIRTNGFDSTIELGFDNVHKCEKSIKGQRFVLQ